MNERLKKTLYRLKENFRRLYGDRLLKMILFGSHARNEANVGSDIDVLVVLRGDVDAGEEVSGTVDIVADLSLSENIVISCVFMGDQRFYKRNGPFLRNVRKEGITI
ncbi:MAG: nucleotidyltransferase domain-containing protein [Candidatus Eremiobacteraeota bacterium]|nr:nucleotidyltransferase domain-containing protein [Candidatus Eremiobacteraeota bacterium]